MPSEARAWIRRLLLSSWLCASAACSGGSEPGAPLDTGALKATVATDGSDIDPDGYVLVVDGTAGATVAVNGSRTVTNLAAGSHSVDLGGVTGNCSVGGVHPVSVPIVANQTAQVSLSVTCQPLPPATGTIRVATTTTGMNLDPDGYTFAIDGGVTTVIGVNQDVDVPSVPIGTRSITLSGLAANCQVGGSNPLSVSVSSVFIAQAPFNVACAAPLVSQVVYQADFYLNLIGADGSGDHRLLNTSYGYEPAWKPGYDWIALVLPLSDDDIALIRPDGTGLTPLAAPGRDASPSFSPDGMKIVYSSGNCGALMTMNLDGTARTPVLADPRCQTEPDWGPSGNVIAFVMEVVSGTLDIYRVNVDGSGLTPLTTEAGSDRDPTWSPDGSRIAFASNRSGPYRIYTMNPDGTGLADLVAGEAPSWSADGSQIVFSAQGPIALDLFVMNANGSNPQPLMTTTTFDRAPAWSP